MSTLRKLLSEMESNSQKNQSRFITTTSRPNSIENEETSSSSNEDEEDGFLGPPKLSDYGSALLMQKSLASNSSNSSTEPQDELLKKLRERRQKRNASKKRYIYNNNDHHHHQNTSINTTNTTVTNTMSSTNILGPAKRNISVDSNTTITVDDLNNTAGDKQIDYSSIEFGDMNPVQIIKKYNLPNTELPTISKLYFEKQKMLNHDIAIRKNRMNKTLIQNSKQFLSSAPPSSSSNTSLLPRKNSSFLSSSPNMKHHTLDSLSPNRIVSSNDNKREILSNLDINKNNNNYRLNENKRKKVEIVEPVKQASNISNSSLITVNDSQYEKIELLGRGGSSKVYKVKNKTLSNGSNKVFALKRVVFDEFDDSNIETFKGEIDLLQKLSDKLRVVKLFDYQMRDGILYLVMECGDHDLSQLLHQRQNLPLDIDFIRYYARELLKCVKVVHDAGIVHSDLKPANFVLVKGILKIIDFGIANSVPDHTVNIYRDSQIGTPNYMAPEALVAMNKNNNNRWKVGKPSDIWSCGCIIYQMIYGKPPYGDFQGQNRLLAIMNPDVQISYPEKTNNNERVPKTAIDTIKSCLVREPSNRYTIDEVLNTPFINPVIVTPSIVKELIEHATNFGAKEPNISKQTIDALCNEVLNRLSNYNL